MSKQKLLKEYVRQALSVTGPGCRYEASVIKSLKIAGAAGNLKRAACSDPLRPDADIHIDGDTFYVEIKSNSHAQMGGGSIGYSMVDKAFYPTGKNRELSETLADLLNYINDSSMHKSISMFVAFLEKKSKRKFDGFPMHGFSPEAWEQAVNKGLLQPINRTLEGNMNVIAAHYERKETAYIQIGGSGFFRLSEANPANLPVPVLDGKVQLEVRVAKGGSGGAGIRVQARLLAKNSSPYTLDDPTSVKLMLRTIQ